MAAPLIRPAGLTLLTLVLAPAVAAAGGWEEVAREAGIVVHEQDVEGRDLPVFRGTGLVKASVYEVLAVLDDVGFRTKWQHRCTASRLIERVGPFETVQYNRTDAPWPADDRDVVLRSRLYTVHPGRVVIAVFESIADERQPEVDGVVRMPRLRGFYRLEAVGEDATRITYQVDADPGGWLPDWIVRRASRELPLKTLQGLRGAVKGAAERYAAFLRKWDPKRRPAEAETPPDPPPYPG